MAEPTEPKGPACLTAAEGREVAALLDPRPTCIVGACAPDGTVGFATILWATPVSHEPAMTAIALRERSHTMGLLRAAGRFSLSTLPASAEAVQLAELCGGSSGHQVDKGALVPHELIDGVPVPEAALSWQLCAVQDVRPAGDHLLVVGLVERAATACRERDSHGRLLPWDGLLCVQHGAYGACQPLAG